MKKRFTIWFVVLIIIAVIVDFARSGVEGHGFFSTFDFPGFYALFGFAACSLIVIISKWIGHNWLQRKEDYYYKQEDNDD